MMHPTDADKTAMTATMMTALGEDLRQRLKPVFATLPLEQAMSKLVVDQPAAPTAHKAVSEAIGEGELERDAPALAAGLWLYVDDLDRSHRISQNLDTPTGSFWHAIMHRREGDFSNSRYWFRRVGTHPAFARIYLGGGPGSSGTDEARYDPMRFIDRVERAVREGDAEHPELVAMQRHEWLGLFEWAAEHHDR